MSIWHDTTYIVWEEEDNTEKNNNKKKTIRSLKRFANMGIFPPQSKFNHGQFHLEAME